MASIREGEERGIRGRGGLDRGGRDVTEGQHTVGRPSNPPLQLTEEEKAVLLECRRNSTARGLLAVAGTTVILRAMIGSGRVPQHIQRWSRVYYTSLGAVSFLLGVRSYRQSCLNKILALDHSVLADQLREHQRKQRQGWSEELPPTPPTTPSFTSPPPPPPPPRQTQSHTVSSDKPFSSAVVKEEDPCDQPDAFSPSSFNQSPLSSQPQTTPIRTRGRTFDEIRDENRRQQKQRQYPTNRAGTDAEASRSGSGKPANVRRNKYGDIISDE